MPSDPKNELTTVLMLAPTAFAANANSSVIDLKDYDGRVAVVVQSNNATAGTSPTADFALHSGSESNGANSVALNINATQITNATDGAEILSVDTRACGRYLKAVGTIGGTNSPSFPISIALVGKKKVQP